jgi:hypothetical protein
LVGEGFIILKPNIMLTGGGIMKKLNFCLWVFLSLIGLIVLASSAFALDYIYTVSGGTVTITKYTGAGGAVVIPSTYHKQYAGGEHWL